MADSNYIKVAQLKTPAALRARLAELGVAIPCDDAVLSAAQQSPMARPLDVGGFTVGNRWCIHPMEGWDGTRDGQPTINTLRRWQHFGASGAKLIWGGEAFAVAGDARANPLQTGVVDENIERAEAGARLMLATLLAAHRETFGACEDLLVGLQLTHSGRFSRPNERGRYEPRCVYHHPLLDRRVGVMPNDDSRIVSDDYIQRTIDQHIRAAQIAQRAGFGFVDIKHCHGYFGHEMLSAFTRPGKFGGSFENRTRYTRSIIDGIRAACPGLKIGVRLSAFDLPPFHPDRSRGASGRLGPGIPEHDGTPYRYAFGARSDNPLTIDLSEPIRLIQMLVERDVKLINLSCGSPYYNPHIQRPAIFPPSDGYEPPEDPLVGVARQIDVVRQLKQACPGAILIGSGYTYLQEYLPHVAQAVVRDGWTDMVGIGRLVLSYWDLIADTLAGRAMQTKRICRTFSDCTTAPRNGMVSGCYPLDEHYKQAPEHDQLKICKAEIKRSLTVINQPQINTDGHK
jgi:2,4-dienoyl-CoA reductase-like NADH-dependent reductase (Old Yellow Enzyme family)